MRPAPAMEMQVPNTPDRCPLHRQALCIFIVPWQPAPWLGGRHPARLLTRPIRHQLHLCMKYPSLGLGCWNGASLSPPGFAEGPKLRTWLFRTVGVARVITVQSPGLTDGRGVAELPIVRSGVRRMLMGLESQVWMWCFVLDIESSPCPLGLPIWCLELHAADKFLA